MTRAAPIAALLLLAACTGQSDDWTSRFPVNKAALRPSGSNQLFPLRPGTRQVLVNGADTLAITVLVETRTIDGVETRVVEEREVRASKLVEISRHYFTIDPATRDVYSFGKDVDRYADGKVSGHEGSWASGVNGAKFGLFMPGTPRLHQRFSQQLAPGVAMDRAQVVALDEIFGSEAGRYLGCVRIEQTTPLEPGARETKVFCPGVGLVRDRELRLVEVVIP
jgi:hypothetical protein